MKANKFVEKFGWGFSIEAVKMMPKNWDYCCLRIPDLEFQKRVSCIADCVDMDDLKRLVESHEIVGKLGGINKAKDYVPDGYRSERLKQAIADVESCLEADKKLEGL